MSQRRHTNPIRLGTFKLITAVKGANALIWRPGLQTTSALDTETHTHLLLPAHHRKQTGPLQPGVQAWVDSECRRFSTHSSQQMVQLLSLLLCGRHPQCLQAEQCTKHCTPAQHPAVILPQKLGGAGHQ